MTANRLALLTCAALIAAPQSAAAAPLDIFQLYGLMRYLGCVDACPETLDIEGLQCRADCGPVDPAWEKNQVAPVDDFDLTLAIAELEDGGVEDVICYRDAAKTIVVPGPLCPGDICEELDPCTANECARPVCDGLPCDPALSRPVRCLDAVCDANPTRDAADCVDLDGDGVPRWLEDHLNTSDEEPPNSGPDIGTTGDNCTLTDTCNFHNECDYDPVAASGFCVARSDCDGACTAFHLEKVAEDDRQLLIHVHYDFSPIPATVLDLRLHYDPEVLVLEDARPLPKLTDSGKQLSVTHLADGVLRLTVFDPSSSDAIGFGDIIELIFQRNGDAPTEVQFVTADSSQTEAMAPEQGNSAIQALLADDSLWGDPVVLADRSEVPRKLLLWYGFDGLDATPSYQNIPDAEAICGRLATCANEPDDEEKGKLTARLERLQRGALSSSEQIDGVSRGGAYFDGSSDHMRLPVSFEQPLEPAGQSFSLSTWFYSEGNSTGDLEDAPQIIYAHNGLDERSRFGLILDPAAGGGVDLSFFVGDVTDLDNLQRTLIQADVALREWHHAGFSLDAPVGLFRLYFDGKEEVVASFGTTPPPVSCPAFADGSDVFIAEEGEALSATPAESLYFAASQSNLFDIRRSDLSGLSTARIIDDAQFSYRDPSYSPILDRLVYASNASGSFEIWTAAGDGSGRQQITVGFGDTERGILARRPRWAPDGSGIVFESNVFSVPDDHNAVDRGYQLYFIGYDAAANEVAIELEGGGIATQLDYEARIADQTIGAHQLTVGRGNNINAWWLDGRDGGGGRGDILFEASDVRFEGRTIRRMQIPSNLREADSAALEDLGDPNDEQRLLSAYRRVGIGGSETAQLFYENASIAFEAASQFTFTQVADASGVTVTVSHDPNGYDPNCWDLNRNQIGDPDENRSQQDPSDTADGVDVADCYPPEIRNLYVQYDAGAFIADTEVSAPGGSEPGAVLTTVNKEIELAEIETSTASLIRIEIKSPFNALPVSAGVIAVIRFDEKQVGASGSFALRERISSKTLFTKDLTGPVPPQDFTLGDALDFVEQAAFSPDGDRLVLAGISDARPVLFKTAGLDTTSGGERIVVAPTRVRGLSWVREQRYFPCNWMGGYQHPQSRHILYSLRGGLDELRLHSGVRAPESFLSEAARGLEHLSLEGRDGPVDSLLPSCGGAHSECPPFHLCVDFQCQLVECDPADFYACADSGGRCTLRPAGVERPEAPGQADPGFDWVCAADCVGDTQCFTEQCFNGPCRFCDDSTLTCIECRDGIQDFGNFQIAGIEGCPDRNSFACVEGSCVTECYAFDDGASIYLCDPTLEYCKQGRCALLEWDWPDLAPASMSGLSETIFDDLPGFVRTTAVGEITPVELKAYGVADYLHPPELIVEGKVQNAQGDLHGGEWFRVGRILVYNRTEVEADSHRYTLHSPYPLTDLRLRLQTPPYENMNAGATGMGARDKDFCPDDLRETLNGADPPDTSVCTRRPAGSRFNVGYRVGIPFHESVKACREKGRAGCPADNLETRGLLFGGQPAVIVSEVKVGGASATIDENLVCSWEGEAVPNEPGTGRPRKVFFGDISQEQSPQRELFCRDNPAACGLSELIDFTEQSDGDFGLLNCNFVDPNNSTVRSSIEFTLPPFQQDLSAGFVNEEGNVCFVEIDAARRELCYEFPGGPSLDPYNEATTVQGRLDITLRRGFAHDEGFTSVPLPPYPLSVTLSGYQPVSGGVHPQVQNGNDLLTFAADGTQNFATSLTEGRRYQVRVLRQPEPPGQICRVVAGQERGTQLRGGSTVEVLCSPEYAVHAVVAGLDATETVELDLNGSEKLTLNANGPAQFATLLSAGSAYAVTVATQPVNQVCEVIDGTGTVPLGGSVFVRVECEDVGPRSLGVVVNGLEGSGLVLRNVNDNVNDTLDVGSDGPHVFTRRLFPGDAYAVTVDTQPSDPVQHCVVTAGTGTMPNADLLNIQVDCSTLPTWAVAGEVVGLEGIGLVLSLNGEETLAVAANGPFTFQTELAMGEQYDVTVHTAPAGPRQSCQIVSGKGTMPAAPVTDIFVLCERSDGPSTFALGGTVNDLQGSGLVLVDSDTQLLDVTAGGSFIFNHRLGDGQAYDVTVRQQPRNPSQHCTVSNGVGIVSGADVTQILVSCEAASRVTLSLDAMPVSGVGLEAYVIPDAASHRRVGQSLGDARLTGNRGTVTLHAPQRDVRSLPPEAVLPQSLGTNYTLYVFINDNDSEHPAPVGGPSFQVGELALRRTITITPGNDLTVQLTGADFQPSRAAPVLVTATGAPANSTLHCWWSHGHPIFLPPPAFDAPVVASSERICQQSGTCFDASGVSLSDRHAPLPATGNYGLTCWIDVNDDGALNGGDYFARRNAAAVVGTTQIALGVQ